VRFCVHHSRAMLQRYTKIDFLLSALRNFNSKSEKPRRIPANHTWVFPLEE
jgi:hypothetical protein